MLGFGWGEILVIAVVVLIVVGPKDLPVMLRNLGRMMGTARKMSNEFRREIDKAIAADEIREAKKAISEPLKQTTADITKEFNSIRDGKIEPSGKLKPSEPGKESVADEIRAQAGMLPKPENAAAAAAMQAKVSERVASRSAQPNAEGAAPVVAASGAAVAPAKGRVTAAKPKSTRAAPKAKAGQAAGSAKAAKPASSKTPTAKAGAQSTGQKASVAKAKNGAAKTVAKSAGKGGSAKAGAAKTGSAKSAPAKPDDTGEVAKAKPAKRSKAKTPAPAEEN